MTEKAIQANRLLSSREIILGKEICLPHISLAMGCIEKADISKIRGVLGQIAEKCELGRLKIPGIGVETNHIGRKVSYFEIERTEPLQLLHEAVMRRLKPYLTHGVTADMVLSPPISESTLRWIENYPEKAAFENFRPHITIGYGQIDHFSFPKEFDVSNLALFHLGNHCTCQDVLLSFSL
jgi:2'-5' RNA ligase